MLNDESKRLNFSQHLSYESDVRGSPVHSQTLLIDKQVAWRGVPTAAAAIGYVLPHDKLETLIGLRGDCSL